MNSVSKNGWVVLAKCVWLLLIIAFGSNSVYSQTWNNLYTVTGPSTTNDQGKGVCVDSAGNFYVLGQFSGTNVDLDPGPGTGYVNSLASNSSSTNLYLAKYSSSGAYLWSLAFQSTNAVLSAGQTIATDGTFVYVGGYFLSSLSIGTTTTLTAVGNTDPFVAKISVSDGSLIWAKSWGGSSAEVVSGLEIDRKGSIYIGGNFQGTTTFGSYNLTSNGSSDLYLAKIAGDGTAQWVVGGGTAGSDGSPAAVGIAYAPTTGKIIFTGTIGSSGTSTGTFGSTAISATSRDMLLAEVDTLNGVISNVQLIGGAGDQAGHAAVFDYATQDVILGGFYSGGFNLPGVGTITNPSSGALLITRYNPVLHSFVWATSCPVASAAATTNLIKGMALNNKGGVFINGALFGNATFGGTAYNWAAQADMFTARLNTGDGTVENSEWYSTTNAESGGGIAVDSTGKAVLCGFANGTTTIGGITINPPNLDIWYGFENVPTVSTDMVSAGGGSILMNAHAINDGGHTITARGFVYSTSANPSLVSGTNVPVGSGTGYFSQDIAGLVSGSTYHIRAYISTSTGTYYGADRSVVFAGASNIAPVFVSGATTTLNVCGTTVTDMKSLLHVTDVDASQTLTWTVLNQPSQDGTVTITGGTAASGTDVTPGGTITYQAATGYSSESFKIGVSDGTAFDTIIVNVTINSIPTITPGTNPSITQGTTTAMLPYTATGGPTTYTIDYDATANAAGFVDVSSATTLTPANITLAVPAGASVGTYNGTVTVSSGSCSSTAQPFTVTLSPGNTAPAYLKTSPRSLTMCHDASAISLIDSLHVSDADAGQTLTWSVNASPGNGTLVLTGATASSGGSDIAPGGTITYKPNPGYTGSDGFTIRVTDGTASSYMSFNVMVNAGPSIYGNSPVDVCSGAALTITPLATDNSTYTWGIGSNTGAVTGASAGSGSTISATLVNPDHTTDAMLVYSVVPTSTVTGCVGNSANYIVNVRAIPLITNAATVSLCSGNSLSLPITTSAPCNYFSWAPVDNPSSVTGTSAGTAPTISQTLTNPGSSAAAYVTYTVAGTSLWNCTSPTDTFTVKVNPKPVLSSVSTYTICSGTTTSITLEASVPATFTWQALGNAIGASNGSGALIAQTLSSGGSFANANTTYALTITSDTGSCVNNMFQNVAVTVQTRPTSTTLAPSAICSGATTSISLTGSVPSTFTWTISSNTGTVSGTSADSGSLIAQTLVNPSNAAAATVVYSVIPTSVNLSCTGTPFTVSQVINANPELTTPSSISLCSGAPLNYTLTASTPSYYDYTPVNVTGGITGSSSGSGGVLSQALTNPGNVSSGVVTYRLIPASQTTQCKGDTGYIDVQVHPVPSLTYPATSAQCTGVPTNIPMTASTPSLIAWAVSYSYGVTGASSGTGDTIKQTLFGIDPYSNYYVQYNITVTSDTGGCVRNFIYLTDTVKRAATISVTSSPSATAGADTADLSYSTSAYPADPLTYKIHFDAAAQAAGFTDVNDEVLPYTIVPANPLTLNIPSGAPSGVYNATIALKNILGCYTMPATAFTVSILNRIPTYTDTTVATFAVCKDAVASDLVPSLHVSDEDGGQTLTWTAQATPAHGTLVVTGATAASGTTDITPAGTITYQPAAGYGGADSFSVKVSDGTDMSVRKFRVWVSDVSAAVTQENVSCNGNADGSAVLTGINGTAPYSYTWAGSANITATITGLAAGSYTATITDANTCTGTKVVTITEPITLTAGITAPTNVSCHGGSNGDATVTVAGGTAPFTYSWSPAGGTQATGTGLSAGNYTVTVTDAHSCNATASVTITEPALVTAAIAGTTTVCNNAGSKIHLSSEAGVSVAYNINGGSTQNAVMDGNGADTITTGNLTAAATYSLVSVTAGGCTYSASGSATVSVYPQATVSGLADQEVCNNADMNSIVFSGPVSGTAFTWTNNNTGIGLGAAGADSIAQFTGVNTGTAVQTATITVTPTANGCEGTPAAFTISVNPTPVFTSTLTPSAICDGNTFSYVPASATTGTSYQWSRAEVTGISNTAANGNNNPDEVLNNTTADPVAVTYVYTLTANGCTNTQDVTVTVNPTPVLSSTKTPATICDSTVFNYVPTSATAGTTFVWERIADESFNNATGNGSDNPAETLYLSGPVGQNAYYVYTLTANGCVDTEHLAVHVQPVPSLSSTLSAPAVCDNATFSYTATSATPATTFEWSRATVTGISNAANSGTGDISETLDNTTTDPIEVTYIYTLSAGGCSRTQPVTVTVNPTPVLTTTLTPSAICDNGTFNYVPASATAGTTFTWSRASVTGITTAANNGNDDPNEALHNSTTDPVAVTYVYTLTANGCTNTQDVTVTVNPTPMLSSTLTATPVCNNTLFSYVPASATAGTAFAWTRETVPGIANAAGSGNDDPNETLVNTAVYPVSVTYVYTLTANGCNNTQQVTELVYPTPMLSSTLTPAAICNNTTFSYVPTSATTGTTYQWSRAAVTGISDAANSGNDDPEEALHNTTANPVAVTYVYTLTANGCTNTQDVTVTVNPTPVLTSTLTAAPVCNNTVFNYTPTSATVGTAYQWSRTAVTGISNAANTGNDDPAETLGNTTTDPIVVTYVYTLTANGCTNTQSVDVTVNPTPVLTTTLTAAPVCDSSLFSYEPASATLGTTYQWSRATVTGISNAAATGADNPGEYLVNTTPDPVNVQYVYTLTANSCTNTQSVTVTVYPKPLLSTTLTPAAICDSTMFAYTPNSLTAGTTYVWSRDAVAGISNPANADNTDPDETLDNTTVNPVAVTYVYTLTANGCHNTQNVTVTVNPTPVLTSTLTVTPLCDSTLFSYVPTSATTGTTFTWSRDTMDNILNASATGTDNPGEYLVNIAPYPVNVMYTYTLTANGCSHTEAVQMTVNPKPLLSSTLAPVSICDSATFSYVPASLTSGTTYNWSRAAVTGIANAAGTGTDNPLEVLYNTTADSIAVNYVYTLTAYGCSNTQNVQVYVKPTPKLSSTLSPAAICNSTVFSYTPASATGGTAFTWTRALVTGISNAAGSGTDNPMETLTNTLVNPVDVPYVFSMAAAGCTHSEVVTVRVNATPKLSSSMTGEVCSTAPFSYGPASATTGTTYAWTRATAPGISNAAGSGTGSVNEVLINQTNLAKTVTYRYTLTANGCSNIQNVVVTVDPTPVIPVIAIHPDAALCSKSQYMNFGASIAAADSTNYNWTAQNAVVYAQGADNTNAIVSFPTSGTANVILTAGVNGYTCYTRDTFTVAVSTSEAPNAEVYYIHDHFIYTDNTVNTYQWGYDDAATLDSVMLGGQVDQNYFDAGPDFTNKKYWVITTKDGCMSKSYYNAPTGVVNVNSTVTVNLTVVPNPASNYVSVAVEGVTGGNDEVELTDLTGKTVITEAVHNNKAQLNVNNLASGIYVVTYYHNGVKAGTAKLVKE